MAREEDPLAMPTGLIGYDPIHIHELTRRVHAALDHLRRVPPLSDPAAAPAVSALRLVRVHLEQDWLPPLTRIAGSTAMTGFGRAAVAPAAATSARRPPAEAAGPPASNSVDSELDPAASRGAPAAASTTQTVLGDGWTFGCGPVSATTGEEVSGCEWMPPERWDLSAPLLVASVLPGSGELLDAYDCVVGDIPCEVVVVPFLSGRSVDALDEVVTGAARATDVARPFTLGSEESWGRPATLQRHFVDHGDDFGSTSADEYARQASAFLLRGVTENLPTKIDPRNGRIRIYDASTNTFGVYNPDGTTATFYKPDPDTHGYPTNMDYWRTQPG